MLRVTWDRDGRGGSAAAAPVDDIKPRDGRGQGARTPAVRDAPVVHDRTKASGSLKGT